MSPTILSLALVLQAPATQPDPPGYWQQSVSYAIDASLDEAAGMLRGSQRVVYRNRSPDTLSTLSFHLHLNAFRPNSRWAQADLAEQRRRFSDLRDPDFGMNQVRNVRIMGQPVSPLYPFAPDSTIVRFALPSYLPPGDSLVAELDWIARPSTMPRRQGRRGRAFDFAQWYPKVVVYDKYGWQEQPLLPAGEFYGEFGDFTVALDLPEDQVVGATGFRCAAIPAGNARIGILRARWSISGITIPMRWLCSRRMPALHERPAARRSSGALSRSIISPCRCVPTSSMRAVAMGR